MRFQRTAGNRAAAALQARLAGGPIAGAMIQRLDTSLVSARAMTRLGHSRSAITHTKGVMQYGAGNQRTDLEASNFNSYFRMKAMREDDDWKLVTSEAKAAAKQDPDAMLAAMADIAHGGNCGEHANVVFDHLRQHAVGEQISRAAVDGLDHAFVLVGDVKHEEPNEVVVSDAWPTAPTPVTWRDHFAYTPKTSRIKVRRTAVADGKDLKSVIAAGLVYTGNDLTKRFSALGTTKALATWKKLWRHPDTFAKGRSFRYVVLEDKPTTELLTAYNSSDAYEVDGAPVSKDTIADSLEKRTFAVRAKLTDDISQQGSHWLYYKATSATHAVSTRGDNKTMSAKGDEYAIRFELKGFLSRGSDPVAAPITIKLMNKWITRADESFGEFAWDPKTANASQGVGSYSVTVAQEQ